MSNTPQLTLSPTSNSKTNVLNLMPPTTIVGQNGGLKKPTGGSATGEFFNLLIC